MCIFCVWDIRGGSKSGESGGSHDLADYPVVYTIGVGVPGWDPANDCHRQASVCSGTNCHGRIHVYLLNGCNDVANDALHFSRFRGFSLEGVHRDIRSKTKNSVVRREEKGRDNVSSLPHFW